MQHRYRYKKHNCTSYVNTSLYTFDSCYIIIVSFSYLRVWGRACMLQVKFYENAHTKIIRRCGIAIDEHLVPILRDTTHCERPLTQNKCGLHSRLINPRDTTFARFFGAVSCTWLTTTACEFSHNAARFLLLVLNIFRTLTLMFYADCRIIAICTWSWSLCQAARCFRSSDEWANSRTFDRGID